MASCPTKGTCSRRPHCLLHFTNNLVPCFKVPDPLLSPTFAHTDPSPSRSPGQRFLSPTFPSITPQMLHPQVVTFSMQCPNAALHYVCVLQLECEPGRAGLPSCPRNPFSQPRPGMWSALNKCVNEDTANPDSPSPVVSSLPLPHSCGAICPHLLCHSEPFMPLSLTSFPPSASFSGVLPGWWSARSNA